MNKQLDNNEKLLRQIARETDILMKKLYMNNR